MIRIYAIFIRCYHHWTARLIGAPGETQPIPTQFWPVFPAKDTQTGEFLENFIKQQKIKYGYGTIGKSLMEQYSDESNVWLKNITVELPTSNEWLVYNIIHDFSLPLYKIPIILSGIVLVVCVVISLEYWECIIFPLIVWSIVNHIMIHNKLSINSDIDQSIPRFVRDVNQSMLGGSSFLKSFNVIQEEKSYTISFNQILEKIKKDMTVGKKLDHIMLQIHTTSHLSKLIIRIISYAGYSGEITANMMEKLAIFSNNYLESKAEINNKTTISIILSYAGSLIVVVLVIMIPAYNMDNFTNTIDGIDNVSLDDTLTSLNLMLVIVTSFLSMILVSKIRYGTVKHSIHNGIVLCMILFILYYDRMIGLSIS